MQRDMTALASIGPRALARGKKVFAAFLKLILKLQLGHALSRVESVAVAAIVCAAGEFLQLGHALSRVESILQIVASSIGTTGFNWATRSRAWKAWIPSGSRSPIILASIGPRALARGKPHCGGLSRMHLSSFNWATRSRAWKEDKSRALRLECYTSIGPRALARGKSRGSGPHTTTETDFNWATRSRAWKATAVPFTWTGGNLLQLGHALSRVESGNVITVAAAGNILQLGHALSRVESRIKGGRKMNLLETSIGPRALARGKKETNGDIDLAIALQLGHALSRVESWGCEVELMITITTSIGPRALARGKTKLPELYGRGR